MRIRFATRGSQLALWQTHSVAEALQTAGAAVDFDFLTIRTTGDRLLDIPLAQIGDRGLFTKELDAALLDGSADVAVHSLKDVPTRLPDELVIAAVTRREDVRDVLVGRSTGTSLATLPPGATVGTSSLRRRAQLAALRPDLQVVDLRGNLNTRLAKLDAGECDALLLAAAGITRLGWTERISEYLEPGEWLPAVGQGALAIVIRADRSDLRTALEPIHDPAAAACTIAERSFLRSLEGGCQVPIAALATLNCARLSLDGLVAGLAGSPLLRDRADGAVGHPQEIGVKLAALLLDRGAGKILADARHTGVRPPQPAAP